MIKVVNDKIILFLSFIFIIYDTIYDTIYDKKHL